MVEMRRGWDRGVFGILAERADEVGSGISIRVNCSDLFGHFNEVGVVIAQRGTRHVANEVHDDIAINICAERPNGRFGSIPDKIREIR